MPFNKKTIKDLSLAAMVVGAGMIGIGLLYFILKPKPTQVVPFTRPPATNAYVPDPDINEWSYKNAIRNDYEALERLEKGIDIGGWNVGNLNPSWERHLQKKYGLA